MNTVSRYAFAFACYDTYTVESVSYSHFPVLHHSMHAWKGYEEVLTSHPPTGRPLQIDQQRQ